MNRTLKPRALFLAGHPVLDFLNTRMGVGRGLQEMLETERDVLLWLQQAGFSASATRGKVATSDILSSARELRENIRSLVERRKEGKRGNPSTLNRFLAATRSYSQIVWHRSSGPAVERIRLAHTRHSILTPIAEAAADLLISANFNLVKRCENESCTLWFLDQTKSHRRRWCSMDLCGNRYKVNAYRSRLRDRAESRG